MGQGDNRSIPSCFHRLNNTPFKNVECQITNLRSRQGELEPLWTNVSLSSLRPALHNTQTTGSLEIFFCFQKLFRCEIMKSIIENDIYKKVVPLISWSRLPLNTH